MTILPFCYADKRGWDSAHPAFSCKEILDSGHSKGDGEYWIDPEKSGNPLKVYCDMSRYGGGWLLVSNVEFGSPSPKVSVETSYRGIGKSYMVLQESAMKELRRHLSFTQLRFHCHKKQGRTFHVVTASNSLGEAVVRYFSGETDEQPDACGSFVRLTLDENSELAGICKDWGRLVSEEYFVGKWGHGEGQDRLYSYPVLRKNKYHVRVLLHNVDDLKKMECDDRSGPNVGTNGDFWRVFVR
ncbi:angiopoietin-4-like [Pocillopora damicornis]|uniref:angiopoietin-4-like n=1 Tax=Pocillopora damicornis TaxID=46731 RepID=UPI000F550D4B|nr:angiopoietin-4-like [Pocillopora damicornis]